MAIIFGIYGNKWAIQNNSYITEEDFTKHQQKFIKISAFLYGISCLGLFTNIIYTSYLHIEAYLTTLDSTTVFQYLDIAQIGICFLNMIVAICISFIWSINAKKIIKIILYVCLFFGTIYFAIKPFSTIIAGHNYLVNPTPKNQLVYYKKVLIDDPKNEYYIKKIREAYCKLGDIDGAIKHLEAHQNDIVKEFDELINLYIIKGEYDKALELSETYNFSRFRVDAYVMKDDYVSALKELELKSELTYYDHLFKLALQKAIEGDIDSDCFEEFVTNNPKIVKKFSNDIESLRKKPTTKKYSSVANFKANILKKRERFY